MGEAEIQALADYVRVLIESASTTTRAEDRTRYERHLGEAAELLPALVDGDEARLRAWIENASASFGRDYLTGGEGDRAENAFVTLRRALGHPQ